MSCDYQPVIVEDLQRAEIEIYQSVQKIHFTADVKALKMNTDENDYQGHRGHKSKVVFQGFQSCANGTLILT